MPSPLTALLGREEASAVVAEQVRDPAVRLLRLTGPGGVGKTRREISAAANVAPAFRDGLGSVPPTAVADPSLFCVTTARLLGPHAMRATSASIGSSVL